MKRHHRAAALLAAVVGAAGCGDRGKAPPAPPSAAANASPPAADSMCKEHGVLEALCTKHNPALIAVFQAKGDWCAEHGFPQSFCPICHPERGGKPTTEMAKADGAPADGTKIRFKKKETARLAGIETARATTRAGGGSVPTTARIVYDATKLAHLNARSPGVVRSLAVDVGATVKKGQPLLVIDSAEVGADRARLAAGRARVELAEENLRREAALEKEGITARKAVVTATQELEAAKGEYAALAGSLAAMGAGAGGGGSYTLTAPIAGVVTERSATIGKMVQPEQVLLEIVDTSSMWAELEVPENDLARVARGQQVTITLDGLPGRDLTGKVDYVAAALDPHTRTALARVALPNPDGALRGQMFGQARIAVEQDRAAVMIPAAAVQRAKEVHLAFVRLAEDQYETRRITLGIREGDAIEVVRGIAAGEEVVTTGSFLLKTETSKESIGAGCCETD
jgi:cobalt-zinc-cadmium efflux system membrane fusion protein